MKAETVTVRTNAMLDAALNYAGRGWPVLPIKPRAKFPPLVSHGYKDASTDADVTRERWSKWPDANIGIRTGDGLVVLDVDPRHGGDDSLAALQEKHGVLPTTRSVLTGTGGCHFYFNSRTPVRCSAGVLGAGLDIRAEGGYIVAPPSIHPNERPYILADASEELAELPGWMLKILSHNGDGFAARPRAVPCHADEILEGQRNSALLALAGAMRRRGAARDAIHKALQAENVERCNPPLPDDEVESIVTSVSRYEAQPARRRCDDIGNSERFVDDHAADLRYVPAHGWRVWDSGRWGQDAAGEVERRAKTTARLIFIEAAAPALTDNERKTLARHANASARRERIRAVIDLAQSDSRVVARPEDFDTDPMLLNIANGTLDLRSGTLRPHSRDDLITRLAPVEFDENAKAPLWGAFLDRIFNGNAALIEFLQRAAGYSLSGDTSEQCFFLVHGAGANGKTVCTRLLKALLGEYAVQADFRTFLLKRDGIPNDVARLANARLIVATEGERNRRLAESFIKQLTGGDALTARYLHKEYFEFTPIGKLWLSSNHKPRIQGTDHAVWRRVRLVPFRVTIPREEQDPHLAEKLMGELPGILNWAVAGCVNWQRGGLNPPDEVLKATQEYKAEQDTLTGFIDACCARDTVAATPSADLWDRWQEYARSDGTEPGSRNDFSSALKELDFVLSKGSGGRRMVQGLRLLEG